MSATSKASTNNRTIIIIAAIAVAALFIIGGTYSFIKKGNLYTNSDSVKIQNSNDVELIIEKWIKENPEKIVESVMAMQQKMMQQQQEEAKSNISSKLDDLYNHEDTPTSTTRNYDVSVVEFFDYNCGYCKRAQKTINDLLNEDKKVRVVFKEFPILSKSSEELAKVALAVNILDSKKYLAFHNALMTSNARTQDDALKVAREVVGLNTQKISTILLERKDEIQKQIEFNKKLGSSIGVTGTPAFIIGEELISGAVGLDVLKAKIAEQRSKK